MDTDNLSLDNSTDDFATDDLGFGSKVAESGSRLMHHDGSFNIERVGFRSWTPYQDLVEMSWTRFFCLIIAVYILINSAFAVAFVTVGIDTISGTDHGHSLIGNFLHGFFFSVQTFTTVGYGAMAPISLLANLLASLCALVGLLSFALFTGLLFARFSKPQSSVLFSQNAIIGPYPEGKQSFQFRIANARDSKIIDLHANLVMTWLTTVPSTQKKQRHYAPLALERDHVFLFPLNWTLVHYIDEKSPLYQKTHQELQDMCVEFLILLKGHDETFAQLVHSSCSYTAKDLKWGVKFKKMYYSKRGTTILDLDELNDFE